ncbi:acyltransferase family protein [Glycocaulis alkaliphilus]|nr:acyltransferase family protein [Glycocaulis alkaliphilus]
MRHLAPYGKDRFDYIQSLDGFRSIAILLVIVFHINESYIPSGFIGVDIFFSISGYIITYGLVKLHAGNGIDLIEFYRRRIARLTPAVVFVVITTLIVSSFVYPSARLSEFAQTGFFAVLWASNIFLFLNSGYFDTVSQGNMFLHTWSLSVEEQFYIFWPLILIAWAKLRFSIYFILSLFIASLFGAAYLSHLDSSAAFYLMPARMFQFIAGALVAIAHIKRIDVGINPVWVAAAMFTGLCFVFFAAAFANGEHYNFWIAALAPTIGSALILGAIRSPAADWLSSPVLRFVGLRAYSLYLVHWPVIVITTYLIGADKPLYVEAGLLVLSFLFAELVYRLVEQPLRIRNDAERLPNRVRTSIAVLSMVAGVAVSAAIWNGSLPGVSNNAVTVVDADSYAAAAQRANRERVWRGRIHLGCHLNATASADDYNASLCMAENPSGRGSLMVIADSYGAETVVLLEQIIPPRAIMPANAAGCLPIYPEPHSASRSQGCLEFNVFRFDAVRREDVRAVALATNWRWWTVPQARSTIEYLASLDKTVVVFGVRPIFSEQVSALVGTPGFELATSALDPYLLVDLSEFNEQLRSLADEFDNVHFVDIQHVLCRSGCRAVLGNGEVIYIDNTHISAAAAEWFGVGLRGELGPVLSVLNE